MGRTQTIGSDFNGTGKDSEYTGLSVVLNDNPLWWHKLGLSYTASGYGKAIPTTCTCTFKGKVRRVYCTIYSNSGTCWIVVDGIKRVIW